eukprot:SAG31_NODE_2252_length_6076_cov_2.828342_4_plen_496_part_00
MPRSAAQNDASAPSSAAASEATEQKQKLIDELLRGRKANEELIEVQQQRLALALRQADAAKQQLAAVTSEMQAHSSSGASPTGDTAGPLSATPPAAEDVAGRSTCDEADFEVTFEDLCRRREATMHGDDHGRTAGRDSVNDGREPDGPTGWPGFAAWFVRLLAMSWRVRASIFCGCACLCAAGALVYSPLTKNLIVSLNPPPDSLAGKAKATFEQYFEPDPILLVALLRSRTGAPIIDPSARITNITLKPPFVAVNFSVGMLTTAADSVSHDLRALVAAELDGICDYSYVSFFDIGRANGADAGDRLQGALQLAARRQLFVDGASATIVVVPMTACHGTRLSDECVGPNKLCKPVVTITNGFLDYARKHNRNVPALDIEVISTPLAYESVLSGVESTMAISTASTPLAMIVLLCLLQNVRLLLIPGVNIVICASGTMLVMYPLSSFVGVSAEAPALMVCVAYLKPFAPPLCCSGQFVIGSTILLQDTGDGPQPVS